MPPKRKQDRSNENKSSQNKNKQSKADESASTAVDSDESSEVGSSTAPLYGKLDYPAQLKMKRDSTVRQMKHFLYSIRDSWYKADKQEIWLSVKDSFPSLSESMVAKDVIHGKEQTRYRNKCEFTVGHVDTSETGEERANEAGPAGKQDGQAANKAGKSDQSGRSDHSGKSDHSGPSLGKPTDCAVGFVSSRSGLDISVRDLSEDRDVTVPLEMVQIVRAIKRDVILPLLREYPVYDRATRKSTWRLIQVRRCPVHPKDNTMVVLQVSNPLGDETVAGNDLETLLREQYMYMGVRDRLFTKIEERFDRYHGPNISKLIVQFTSSSSDGMDPADAVNLVSNRRYQTLAEWDTSFGIEMTLRLQGEELKFRVAQNAFFQTNTEVAELMIDHLSRTIKSLQARQGSENQDSLDAGAATSRDIVLMDLCCGTGVLGLAVAHGLVNRNNSTRLKILGVDIIPAAIKSAEENARYMSTKMGVGESRFQCKYIAAPVQSVISNEEVYDFCTEGFNSMKGGLGSPKGDLRSPKGDLRSPKGGISTPKGGSSSPKGGSSNPKGGSSSPKGGSGTSQGASSTPKGEQSPEGKPLVIALVDPPRSGLTRSVIQSLICAEHVQHVVYVSCNPKSLFRDMELFCGADCTHSPELAFKPASEVTVFDMFPQTEHYESVVLLSRGAHRKSPSAV